MPHADRAVTVVLPVFNGAAQLGHAIDSVLTQTIDGWRLVVVDDGSTDQSAQIVRECAGDDPRVTILSTPHGGVSQARNAGIDDVRTEWVLFLDHDDWLSPEALEDLLQTAAEYPEADCIFAGWTAVTETGATERRRPRHRAASGLPTMATRCPFPLHCAISRTERIREVGAFDPVLSACEDWDLWLRLARAGARFKERGGELAGYRITAGSASTGRHMLASGLLVIDRAFAVDERVGAPLPEYRDGAPPEMRSGVRVAWSAYAAGLSIGAAESTEEMLGTLAEEAAATAASLETLAYELHDAVPRARGAHAALWWRLPAEVQRSLDGFLSALDDLLPGEGAELRVRRRLEDLTFADSGPWPAGDEPPPRASVGRTLAVAVDLAAPLADLRLPDGVDRVHCRPAWREQPLTGITLAASDGFVPGWVLLDACAAENAWPLAQALMREAAGDGSPPAEGDTAPDDWETFLREVWGQPDWPEAVFYDPDGALVTAPVHVAVGPGEPVVIDVCDPPKELASGAVEQVDVELRVFGQPCFRLRVAAEGGRVSAHALIAAINTHSGFELCRAVVRRALQVHQPPGTSIREALVRAAGQPEVGHRWRIGQRVDAVPGTAAFRAVVLPGATYADLAGDARDHGEPVTPSKRDAAGPVVYDPTLLGAATAARWPAPAEPESPMTPVVTLGRHAFESLFASSDDPWGYSSPYEVVKYEQTLELVPAGTSRVLELACGGGHFTRRLAERVTAIDAVDVSEVALAQARRRCAGLSNITFRRADLFADRLGSGYDGVVCSEVLYYAGSGDVLSRTISSIAGAVRRGGLLITAHANALVDDPGAPGFDWDVPFGAEGIERAILADGRLALVRDLRTELYRIQAYRRRSGLRRLLARDERPVRERVPPASVLPADVQASFRPEGGVVDRCRPVSGHSTLPILMYHRVAPSGAPAMRQWRVTPEELREQLAYLRSVGYHSVTLEAWRDAVVRRRPLPGKPIALTFDDGYVDFDVHARPLLEQYGFDASLFVVTDHVGAINAWDSAREETPLMDWDTLRRLAASGFAIGAHTATHPRLTALSDEQAVREVSRSRRALHAELGVAPKLFAAPYGLRDSGIDALIGGCGFELAVTCEEAAATLSHRLLRLPRLEVSGGMGLESFVRMLGS